MVMAFVLSQNQRIKKFHVIKIERMKDKLRVYPYPVESPYYVKPKVTINNTRRIGKTNSLAELKENHFRVCLNISVTKDTRKWIPLTDYSKKMICKKAEWNSKSGMFKKGDKRNDFIQKVIFVAYRIIIKHEMTHKKYDHEKFMKKFNKALFSKN